MSEGRGGADHVLTVIETPQRSTRFRALDADLRVAGQKQLPDFLGKSYRGKLRSRPRTSKLTTS